MKLGGCLLEVRESPSGVLPGAGRLHERHVVLLPGIEEDLLQPVAHEQEPKAPGLEPLRARDLSGEVGVLPIRHGLGRVQGDGAYLGSSLSFKAHF